MLQLSWNLRMVEVVANWFHFLALFVLLLHILRTRNCKGISGKTQFLYAIIFTIRFLDASINTPILDLSFIMKFAVVVISYSTLILIYNFFNQSQSGQQDSFRIRRIILPCAAVSLLINDSFTFTGVLIAFSNYLEALAILPQIHLIGKAKNIEKIVMFYMGALFAHKDAYLLCWASIYYTTGHFERLTTAASIIQAIIFLDFFLNRLLLFIPRDGENDDKNTIFKISNDKTNDVEKTKYNQLSSIVLTPEFLVNSDVKENLLPDDEEKNKF